MTPSFEDHERGHDMDRTMTKSQTATILITVPGEDGGDSYEYHATVPAERVRFDRQQSPLYRSERDAQAFASRSRTRTVLTVELDTFTINVEPGVVTKGAAALWRDKHPVLAPPKLNDGTTDPVAIRLRRKAHAVLVAAGVL